MSQNITVLGRETRRDGDNVYSKWNAEEMRSRHNANIDLGPSIQYLGLYVSLLEIRIPKSKEGCAQRRFLLRTIQYINAG